MILLFTPVICIIIGIIVVINAENNQIRFWLGLLCLSLAMLSAGLYQEIYGSGYIFLAAKINMTTGLIMALTCLRSASIMCEWRVHRSVWIILGFAVIFNFFTIWLTDINFRGDIIHYSWGNYVAGKIEFIMNPGLVAIIAMYLLFKLGRKFHTAHPLDKNRIKFIFTAFCFLSIALFDYLPHYGVDLFGGPLSGFAIPLFLATFGYANMRYRLIRFSGVVARVSGWSMTVLILAAVYALVLEAGLRWFTLPLGPSHISAAIVGLLVYGTIGSKLPSWITGVVEARERALQDVIEAFSMDIQTQLEESELRKKIEDICTGPIDCSFAFFNDNQGIRQEVENAVKDFKRGIIEVEVLRRRNQHFSQTIMDSEIVIPLYFHDEFLGILTLGKRNTGEVFSGQLQNILKMLGNFFALALKNVRGANELQLRSNLDRFLGPQIVERMLHGSGDTLERRERSNITIFFSDIVGFTPIADNLSPEVLSTILNDYLSEMSQIAFDHNGTIDKFIGDAVMVFFGAPIASPTPEQIENALNMALTMNKRLAELNRDWLKSGVLSENLMCRMGIHSGEATIGSFGSSTRADYTVIGRAVNLASRLETACTPGRVLISESSWNLISNVFPIEPIGRGYYSIKGFSQEVAAVELQQLDLDKA